MKSHLYMLDRNKKVVPMDDTEEWGRWMQTDERILSQTMVSDVMVSTVFLGIDHSFGDGPPIMFESMVFGGSMDGEQRRYTSYKDAMKGHEKLLTEVRSVV